MNVNLNQKNLKEEKKKRNEKKAFDSKIKETNKQTPKQIDVSSSCYVNSHSSCAEFDYLYRILALSIGCNELSQVQDAHK